LHFFFFAIVFSLAVPWRKGCRKLQIWQSQSWILLTLSKMAQTRS